MGRVTSLQEHGIADLERRFAEVKRLFEDGTIRADTPLILYYEGPEVKGRNSIGLEFLNMTAFEAIAYFEILKQKTVAEVTSG